MEDKHPTGSLIIQQYPGSLLHNYYLTNLIACELDIISTEYYDTNILTYEIDLPPSGKKIGFNLMDDEDFTIPRILDKSPNLPAGHQLLTQAKKNAWIISTNGKEPITDQGTLDELQHNQTQHGKSMVKTSL